MSSRANTKSRGQHAAQHQQPLRRLSFSRLYRLPPLDGRFAFRAVVVAAELATLWITWPLWMVRETPPLLPAVDLPQWDVGPWIAGSALLLLLLPRFGLVVHAALIAWAMLLDQTRMQPQMVSFVCLITRSTSRAGR